MGWMLSYSWPNKKVLVNYLTSPRRLGDNNKLLASSVRGNHHWYVVERADSGERFIGLDLMSFKKGEGGYKDMCESMGPYYYDCPLKFLKMVPVANAEWREKVRAFHSMKKNAPQFTTGDRVVYSNVVYSLHYSMGRKGWAVKRASDDMLFRLNHKQLLASDLLP